MIAGDSRSGNSGAVENDAPSWIAPPGLEFDPVRHLATWKTASSIENRNRFGDTNVRPTPEESKSTAADRNVRPTRQPVLRFAQHDNLAGNFCERIAAHEPAAKPPRWATVMRRYLWGLT